jgi:hypothetical protein
MMRSPRTLARVGPGGVSHSAGPVSILDPTERLANVGSQSTALREGAMKCLCRISLAEKKLDMLIDGALAFDLDGYLREMKRRQRKHGRKRKH